MNENKKEKEWKTIAGLMFEEVDDGVWQVVNENMIFCANCDSAIADYLEKAVVTNQEGKRVIVHSPACPEWAKKGIFRYR